MSETGEKLRIFVGADRSQAFAVRVLEHSIKRHTNLAVELLPMLDLPVREPKHPHNLPRTGFSFSRFCIPKLAGYRGKALYLDADMLVFKDIRSLWEIPFDGAKAIIQQEVKHEQETIRKQGAPARRPKQCAVMLLDCQNLDWDIDSIIDGLDAGLYDYEALMYDLVILDESEIKFGIPFEWNSLEYYDPSTCLIHYTDMYTQPWVSSQNANGYLWFDEVRLMLKDGTLSMEDIEREIGEGYLRPSMMRDLKYGQHIPRFLQGCFALSNTRLDRLRNYVPHRQVYAVKKRRMQAETVCTKR